MQFECSDVCNPELQMHFAALEHAALELQVSFCPSGASLSLSLSLAPWR